MSHLTKKKKKSKRQESPSLDTPCSSEKSLRSPMSGSSSTEFTLRLRNEAVMATPRILRDLEKKESMDELCNLTEGVLRGIAPQDEIEGMLAAQMMAIHQATMNAFVISAFSGESQSMRSDFLNQNQGVKLSRAFATLTQTLSAYRESKNANKRLMVREVNVHEGGQAIVGSVNQKI